MKDLKNYLDRINFTNKLFGGQIYAVKTLTQADVDVLCQKIDSDLSPENLTCDGELSRAQVNAKYRMLVGTLRDLHALGFTVTVSEV